MKCFAASGILPGGATNPLLLAMHWKLSRSLICDLFPALGSSLVRASVSSWFASSLVDFLQYDKPNYQIRKYICIMSSAWWGNPINMIPIRVRRIFTLSPTKIFRLFNNERTVFTCLWSSLCLLDGRCHYNSSNTTIILYMKHLRASSSRFANYKLPPQWKMIQ